MPESRVGPPVRGEDCYGREALVKLLGERLAGGHILLAAPRRFGKTSVMYRLMDEPKDGYKLIHADLEHFIEPAELITQLIVQLTQDSFLAKIVGQLSYIPKTLWEKFTKSVEEVELLEFKLTLREQLRPHWKDKGEELFKRVAEARQTIVFVLDEFPMMIDRMARSEAHREEARTLLRWLRSLRLAPTSKNIRFLIAGSIGIDRVLTDLGEIAAINDLEQVRLAPFSPQVAATFLDALATRHKIILSLACKRKMMALVGTPIPYFLQIMFSEVRKMSLHNGAAVTPKMIEQVYRDKLLGVDCKTYFEHYYGRLRDYYQPQEERAAKRMLRELAAVGPLSRDACFQFYRDRVGSHADLEEFNRLMTDLENDFYIRFNAEVKCYEFSCKLLSDWWLRHYGMQADA